MGDARRRGTREQRVAESQNRHAIEAAEAEARARRQAIVAANLRAETDAKRAAAGLQPSQRKRTQASIIVAALAASAMGVAASSVARSMSRLNDELAKQPQPPTRLGHTKIYD